MSGEVLVTQISGTVHLRLELLRLHLVWAHAKATKRQEEIRAREPCNLGSSSLRHALELVPLDRRHQPQLGGKLTRVLVQGGERSFRHLHHDLDHGSSPTLRLTTAYRLISFAAHPRRQDRKSVV